MTRPMPVPWIAVRSRPSRLKGWNSSSICSGVMPMPVSVTAISTHVGPGQPAGDVHPAAVDVVLDGVAQQVGEDLLDPRRVADDRRRARRRGPALIRMPRLAASLATSARRRRDQLGEVERRRLQAQVARLDARQVEHVVDHLAAGASRPAGSAPTHGRCVRRQRMARGRARAAGRSRAWRSAACAARGSCATGTRSWRGSTPRPPRARARPPPARRCSVMSSTTPTMRHGSLLAIAQQRDRRAHPDDVAGAVQAALVAPVHRDLAGDQLRRQRRRRWRGPRGASASSGLSAASSRSLVAGQLAEARIGLDDAAGEVGVDDADRHVVEDVAKALLARAQRGLGDLALADLGAQGRRCARARRSRCAASGRS